MGDVGERSGPAEPPRTWSRHLRALAPTLLVVLVAELAARLGLYERDLDWAFIALSLIATTVYAAARYGIADGMACAAIAWLYQAYVVLRPGPATLPVDALEVRRQLVFPAVILPLAYVVGWQKRRIEAVLDREQAARSAAEAARDEAGKGVEREAFLRETARTLSTSLDVDRTLRTLADRVVPELADLCVIDVQEDHRPRRLAHAAVDPEKERALRDLGRAPELLTGPSDLYAGLRRGEPLLISDDAGERVVAAAADPRRAELLRRLDFRSVLVVPLEARGRILGVLGLGSSSRRFDRDDVAFAQLVATHASNAIDNAQLHEAAVDSSRAKTEFLAIMSHELRTPLTAVIGYAELLEMGAVGPLTDEQRRSIRQIKTNAQDLVGMIDEILTFSRLEDRRERVRVDRVDLGRIIAEHAARFDGHAREKGLDYRVDIPPDGVIAETDPAKVGRIATNLLANAFKFTEAGHVSVRLRCSDGDAVLRVADTGIGIPPEQLPRIFEPFWQAQRALTREYGGTGLGLAVARRLARALGGDISVESRPGVGSTFTVRLPGCVDQAGAAGGEAVRG